MDGVISSFVQPSQCIVHSVDCTPTSTLDDTIDKLKTKVTALEHLGLG